MYIPLFFIKSLLSEAKKRSSADKPSSKKSSSKATLKSKSNNTDAVRLKVNGTVVTKIGTQNNTEPPLYVTEKGGKRYLVLNADSPAINAFAEVGNKYMQFRVPLRTWSQFQNPPIYDNPSVQLPDNLPTYPYNQADDSSFGSRFGNGMSPYSSNGYDPRYGQRLTNSREDQYRFMNGYEQQPPTNMPVGLPYAPPDYGRSAPSYSWGTPQVDQPYRPPFSAYGYNRMSQRAPYYNRNGYRYPLPTTSYPNNFGAYVNQNAGTNYDSGVGRMVPDSNYAASYMWGPGYSGQHNTAAAFMQISSQQHLVPAGAYQDPIYNPHETEQFYPDGMQNAEGRTLQQPPPQQRQEQQQQANFVPSPQPALTESNLDLPEGHIVNPLTTYQKKMDFASLAGLEKSTTTTITDEESGPEGREVAAEQPEPNFDEQGFKRSGGTDGMPIVFTKEHVGFGPITVEAKTASAQTNDPEDDDD